MPVHSSGIALQRVPSSCICGSFASSARRTIWVQAYGDAGYAAKVDHSFSLALHFEQRIQQSGGAFVLARPRSFVNVCFWWIPASLRPFDAGTASQEQLDTLDKVRTSAMP